MKIFPNLLLTAALIFGAATAASAYSLSPPDKSARLRGTLTFTPNEGGQPFTCKVILYLTTRAGGKIKSVGFPSVDCEAVNFQDLPWGIDLYGPNSGQFSFGSFGSGDGNCIQDFIQFQTNSSGVWTLPAGQCLSGTLTSHPPVTIVP